MKKAFTLILVVLTAVLLLIPSTVTVDGADVEIRGKIVAGENVVGLEGVKINVYDDPSLTNMIDTEETNENGEFFLSVPDTITIYLEINRSGYEVNEDLLASHKFLTFESSYVVSLDMTDMNADTDIGVIFLSPSFGTVTGTVTNADGAFLTGARIEYTSTNGTGSGIVFVGNDGTYTIEDIPTGRYNITVSHRGYISQTIIIDVQRGTQSVPTDFTLEVNKAEYLFGLDLAHSVMLFCGIIGFLLIMATLIYRIRLKDRDDIDDDEIWEDFEE